jgi:hypothetical protein
VLEDYLPVSQSHWSSEGIDYTEEAFAIPLSGPLSPEDPGRSEQTPAVFADIGKSVRAHIRVPEGSIATIESCKDDGSTMSALHVTRALRPDEEAITIFALPFIPGLSREEQAQLAVLQYDPERARIVDYWRGVIGVGMPFRVPEPRFNAFARALIAHVRISTTKDPKSGLYMVPAASYRYRVFANEASFQAQLLDAAGHHHLAEKYMQTFVDLQGSRPLVGSFSGDQSAVYHGTRVDAAYDYTASSYNLDHGTVLWTLAEHYFIMRDRAWLARVAPSMKHAADWITTQRQLTKVMVEGKRCPEYGLLPAGHLEDNRDWGHWFSVNAYGSAGLSELAQALEEIGDADAAKYRHEAERYRQDLRTAVLRAAAEAPVIRLRDNTWVPYVPTRAHQRIRLFGPLRVAFYSRYPEKALPTYRLSATRELLYGPLILLDAGIFDATEQLATWVLDDWEDNSTMSEPLGLHVHGWVDEKYWFSRGGMVFQANLQNPIRTYLRRGEARAAIRNLYNDFVACYYPDVNVFTEEFRQWRAPSGPFYKVPDEAKFVHRLRDLLVMEYKGDLHLAAGTPIQWLAPGRRIEVTGAPTYFGPVSYWLEASAEEVRGTIELPSRNPFNTAWLNVRLPDGKWIVSVFIDRKEWTDFDAAGSRVRLPKRPTRMEITVKLAGK